jgi:hypothetical protein
MRRFRAPVASSSNRGPIDLRHKKIAPGFANLLQDVSAVGLRTPVVVKDYIGLTVGG